MLNKEVWVAAPFLSLVIVIGLEMSQMNTGTLVVKAFGRSTAGNFAYYTFRTNLIANVRPGAEIVQVGGTNYGYGQMPLSDEFQSGSFNIYSFSQTVPTVLANKKYVLNGVNATCGLTGRQQAFYPYGSCTITATYITMASSAA